MILTSRQSAKYYIFTPRFVEIVIGKPWVPSIEDLMEKISPAIAAVLTNNGPLVREFENRLEKKWGVKNVVAVSNGTMAIQLALRALGQKSGEVPVTAYTWHAINCDNLRRF